MIKPLSPKDLGSFLFFVTIPFLAFSQASNNTCATATVLSVSGDCSAVAGDLYLANSTNPTGGCGSRPDVWYKFTVPASSTFVVISVTLTSSPSGLTTANTFIELFNTNNCTINGTSTGGCNDISAARRYTGLTAGGTYYFRIYTTATPNVNPSQWGFSVCVTSNDNCATAATLSSYTTSAVLGASNSGVGVGSCTGNPDDDVWYKFVAEATDPTLTLNSVGSSLNTSGPRMQLFSGSCGALTSLACGTTGINATGLTIGSTYYVRVYSAGTGQAGFTAANSAFQLIVTPSAPATVGSGRMSEVYQQTVLSGPGILADPWEVTYGPDNFLWVTESKGYKAYRIDPATGDKTTILDISQGASGYLTAGEHTTFNCQFPSNQNPWPQGGFAGLALHPKFLDPVSPKNYVYISYVHRYDSTSVNANSGVFFTNSLVRFTYNTSTGKLESPVALCDTLPGSSDHNSQRLAVAPVAGTDYLFYAAGDMGAGQFGNQYRTNRAQIPGAYQGKILRFNLEADGDAGTLDKWIPNSNPFNGASQSAVWCLGIRNNQGFAYDTTLGILYGASHGPYSDDEINIIQSGKNYGHPFVIGYAADGNYNNSSAGSPNTTSACPIITDEVSAAAAIPNYKDPLYAAYAVPQATVHNIWVTNPSNGGWPSEAWSGMDIYKHTLVPGWKNSLVLCSLKWGRVLRMKLGPLGTTIVPTNGTDTISYFGSTNRYRDLAFAPNGKDMYVIMDRSSTTSGPSANNPIVPACGGCLIKYSFLGYADVGGKSSIPDAIDVTDATVNTVDSATTITIDNTNNNLWVPITGPDGNILAEIYANGNNLGTVRSALYQNSGAIRTKSGVHYLDRNMTITPDNQPSTPVKIRLYFSKAEFDALNADALSGVNAITDLKILKNSDPCGSSIASTTTPITPAFAEAHGANGYMLQGTIASFSSFYFASSNVTLPLHLLTFKGTFQNNSTLLEWETTNEVNTSSFLIERSTDGKNFQQIGITGAKGNSNHNQYSFTDYDAARQSSLVLFYRLKMVDRDGGFTYSNVVTINLPAVTGNVAVFPNPASNEVMVVMSAPADGKVRWKLTDNTGRVLIQNSVQARKGNNSMSIQIGNLSTGFYYLSVTGAGMDQKVKLEKM